jgi:serine-type D-Ala-D-Ala endopeptidase (penicillin-binding protein 7)
MKTFVKSFNKASLFVAGAALLVAISITLSPSAFAKTAEKNQKSAGSKAAVVKKTTTAKVHKSRSADAASTKSAQKVRTKPKTSKLAARSGKPELKATQKAARKGAGKDQRLAKARTTSRLTKVSARSGAAAHAAVVRMAPMSSGMRLGLRDSEDPLDLGSSVALVMDQDTNEILFSKNDHAVLPIASITKLMTGLVIADANLPMDEMITITQEDVDMLKGSRSRLAVGTTLSRGELMHLSLMSSENRAANALGRTYPGGMKQFVAQMNATARALGMTETRYVEPTGLMSQNQSSARDLATLVNAAYERPILRSLSTSPGHQIELGHRTLQYNNSNRLVHSPQWDIGLQKTGYISEAGRCLVMQAKVAGRKLIMVFLDSSGKLTRLEDAERVRRWIEAQSTSHMSVRPQG